MIGAQEATVMLAAELGCFIMVDGDVVEIFGPDIEIRAECWMDAFSILASAIPPVLMDRETRGAGK